MAVKNNPNLTRVSGNRRHVKAIFRAAGDRWRYLFAILLLLTSSIAATAQSPGLHRVEDLDYGRALYQFFQQNELAAITRLLVAEQRPRSRPQVDEANLLLADLYYGYGLYNESQRLFARLLSAEVSDSIQNRIWFNLARLNFDQGIYQDARDLLSRINDQLPPALEAERKYLLTNLYLGNRQYDQAADLSNGIDDSSIWKIYARYNLAVMMIEDDRFEEGRYLLDRIGQLEAESTEQLALRDQANLSLGLKHLRLDQPEAALESLSRIRLEGPLSHDALLASGWAWYGLGQFDKALVPWRILLRRNAVDAATQEAILAIPSNYASSGQYRLATRYYENAAEQFDAQLRLLDNAIVSIQQDELIAALRENAILYDRSSLQRLPPSSDVTPQLHLLLASAAFQQEIKRYQDLLDIRNSLRYWGNSFPALELMLSERRNAFQRKLPLLQQTTSFDKLETLTESRNQFAKQLNAIESGGDYLALASSEEQAHLDRLDRIASSIEMVAQEKNTSEQKDMHRLLSGILHWNLATDYPARFWKAKKQLIGLNRALQESHQRAASLRRITEHTGSEFSRFADRIYGQQSRISSLGKRVSRLLKRQEQHINQLAIAAIQGQQKHIVQLRLNARFELAKLYDKLSAQ